MWPRLPVPPVRLHAAGDRWLVVGVDGDLVWVDAATLAAAEAPVRPFPSRISRSLVVDGVFVGGWVDHEVGVARLAGVRLDQPFEAGVDRTAMRRSLIGASLHRPRVAGAAWSHELQAEPLALAGGAGHIGFALHTRGVYRVDEEAAEQWRRPLPMWAALPDLPDAAVLIGMRVVDDALWLWSLAGGWQCWGWEDGEERRRGIVQVPDRLEFAVHDARLGWLLICRGGRLVNWQEDGTPVSAEMSGPVQAAEGDGACWRLAGWREDILWVPGSKPRTAPRDELGVAVIRHPDAGWLTVDNTGRFSAFGVAACTAANDVSE